MTTNEHRTRPGIGRRRWLAQTLGLAGLAGLGAGCAVLPGTEGEAHEGGEAGIAAPSGDHVTPFSAALLGQLPSGWRPYALRRDLPRTRYQVVRDADSAVLHARALRSATGLQCALALEAAQAGPLRFRWKVRSVPDHGNVAAAERDDCPARVVVAFDGDHERLSLRDRLFFDQVELFTGQRLPYAMLMYVWDGGTHAVESVHRNHRTARIQYLTVESGPARAGRWLSYERDLVADYRRVFREAPGRIIGVGVLTDGDALKLDLEAWYGDITLAPRPLG